MNPELQKHFNRIYVIEEEKKKSMTDFLFGFFLDMCSRSINPIPIIIRICNGDQEDVCRVPVNNVCTIHNGDNTWTLVFEICHIANGNVSTNRSVPSKLNPHITDLDISIFNDKYDHTIYPVDYIRFHDGMIEIIHNTELHEDKSIVNPKVFTEKMKQAVNMGRETEAHEEADRLMAELLIQLGYKEAVDMFFNLNKYY